MIGDGFFATAAPIELRGPQIPFRHRSGRTLDMATPRSGGNEIALTQQVGYRSLDASPTARHAQIPYGLELTPLHNSPKRYSRRWHRGRSAPAQSRLFQPSTHARLGVGMRDHATFRNGHFASGNAFQNCHSLLHPLIALYIHEIGARQPMLSN